MTRFALPVLHRQLFRLVAVAMLPIALLSLAGLIALANQQRTGIEQTSLDTVRALNLAVDNELRLSIAAAEALAASSSLATGNLRVFHKTANDVLLLRQSWSAITLTDLNGDTLLNTRESLETTARAAREVIDRESYARAIATRRPVVGSLVRVTDGELQFPVRVPVIIGKEVKYVLSADIRHGALRKIVEQQKLPPGGVVAIFDPHGTIVHRSLNHERFVGKPVSPTLLARTQSGNPEGYGVTTTLDGTEVYTAFNRSDLSDWGIAIDTPTETIDAAVRHSYLLLGAGLLLSLIIGALAATLMARRIIRPLRLLRRAALTNDAREPVLPEDTLPEMKDMSRALHRAAHSRSQADAEHENKLQRERTARTHAEDSNRMKDEFLAMLGHELRNPLAAISAAGQVLAARITGDEAAQRASGILERQTRHLAHLVDDLLDITRVMAGKIVLDRRPLDLGEAARHVVATLKSAGQLGRHVIKLDLEQAWVSADANRLEQIVTNLVVNAVKYTPPEGKITVTVEVRTQEAVLRVEDTGIGIEESLQPRIFDLFVQGRQALHRAQGGLGVGLTLVHRLVGMHHGTVKASSGGVNRGSVFTVRLPLAEAPAMPVLGAPRVPVAGGCKVLLVEDNDDARSMMRILLETDGHGVREAADGSEGVASAESSAFDVAFVDIGLPTVDGYEVARRIREIERAQQRSAMCLVALTGYGQASDRARALAAGFDQHLAKPVDPAALQEVFGGLKRQGLKDVTAV